MKYFDIDDSVCPKDCDGRKGILKDFDKFPDGCKVMMEVEADYDKYVALSEAVHNSQFQDWCEGQQKVYNERITRQTAKLGRRSWDEIYEDGSDGKGWCRENYQLWLSMRILNYLSSELCDFRKQQPENKPTANPSNIAVTATDTKGQQPVVYNLDIFIANSQLTKQNTNKARLAFEAMKKNGYYETSDDGVYLWKTTKAELSYFASVMIKKFKFPKRKSWVLFEKLFNHEKLCQAHSEISNIYAKNYSKIDTIISESQRI